MLATTLYYANPMNMRKLVIGLMTAICLFTASVAEGFCCVEEQSTCAEHQEHSKQPDEKQKDASSHSCCHAHNIAIKSDKFASSELISTSNDYIIIYRELVTQFQPGILLEPPAQA